MTDGDPLRTPLIFALHESAELARAIAREAGLEIAPLEERPFEGGEFKLRPLSSVRGRPVVIVQSLAGSAAAPAAERVLRLLFLMFGLRDAGAATVTVVIPYMAFARKDRRTQPRDPVTQRYLAQLLEAAGLSRLIALDVHNPAALDNAFRVPMDHLSALPMFAAQLCGDGAAADLVVASPDVGGIKRAQLLREMLERRSGGSVELVFIEKRRAKGVVSGGSVVGNVHGRRVVVLDDLCATGGTLIRAAKALRAAGAGEVLVAVTHAPHEPGLAALRAEPDIARVLVSDSVGWPLQAPGAAGKLSVLPVAPLFGQALARIASGRPLAPLLDRWPPD